MVAEQRGCSTASAEMAEYVQRVGEQPSELLVEEWNLLPLVYKNAVGNRRAAWRVITSVEHKETSKGDEQLVVHESKDAITDLLEFTFHFLDVFSRI